ncbi:MAG: hypothetical protein N3G79_03520 [Sulfolobales archaeon]|nr:hypothetical protein [Sulfolobales archaeon]
MKPSKEVSVGLIRTLLSRPPRLRDMLEAALKDLDLGVESVSQQYGFRVMFVNLRDVRSYEELDKHVFSILKSEVRDVVRALPDNYVNFTRTFFELMDTEVFCLKTPSASAFSSSLALLASAESDYKVFESLAARMRSVCGERGIEGAYTEYLGRVLKSLTAIDEDYRWVYETIKSLVALHYYRYSKNSALLGLEAGNLELFLMSLHLDPLAEVVLRKSLEILGRVDAAGLSKYTVYEASEALDIATKLIYFREGLIDLLAFYLTTKYYESRIVRYVFLPKVLRRW